MSDSQFLQIAKQAAQEAGNFIASQVNQNLQVGEKTGSFDLVTQVDLESEKKILTILKKNFPDHNIVTEEKGKIQKKSEYTWFIDPLDGTIPFIHNMPFYSVFIGLTQNDQPILGVIYRIAEQKMLWAEKGNGAFSEGKKIGVNGVEKLESAIVGVCLQNSAEQRKLDAKRYELFSQKALTVVNLISSGHTISLIAEGKMEGFVHYCKPWDFVAAAAILEEAGGKATDWQGNEIDWSKDWIEGVFSNGKVHDQLVSALANP